MPTVDVQIPSPAAGGEISYTLAGVSGPATLLALTFRLVTSAVAGNRFPVVIVNNGLFNTYRVASAGTYAPSADRFATFAAGLALTTGGNIAMNAALPSGGIYVPRGGIISTSTFALDVGDQFSAITAVFGT